MIMLQSNGIFYSYDIKPWNYISLYVRYAILKNPLHTAHGLCDYRIRYIQAMCYTQSPR